MKVTKNYIKQLVKEELNKVLKESNVSGMFRIFGDDRLEYNVNGNFGSVSGRQSLLIAVDGFEQAQAGTWKGSTPEKAAANAGGVWAKELGLAAEDIAQALLDGSIKVIRERAPQDTSFSYTEI